MPVQAIPLVVTLAASLGVTVPFLANLSIENNIDLSTYDYDPSDLTAYEDLFPKQAELKRIKEFKTYEDSFYPKPVTENTDLSGIILETKKDDKEVKETINEQGELLFDVPDQMPEPPEDPDWKIKPNWKNIATYLLEEAVDQTVTKLEDKFIDLQKEKKKGVTFAPEKTNEILRLHKFRLQKVLDGKTETYPGNPINERIVLNGPKGSDLPPIAIGDINFEDWTNKITLSDEEIFNQKDWYKKVFESFNVIAEGDQKVRDTIARAWLSGQINESPTNALTNVLYIYEQFKRGVPFNAVKGKSLPAPTNNVKSIIYGKDIKSGIGPKISDFIDAGEGKVTRSIMEDDKSGGIPFVVDVHTARDTGMVDQTYLNKLEDLGYIIPENIKTDFGKGGIQGTKYENRSLYGQDLTKYLNDINWKGKNDWSPTEVQAIGWMNLTKMYGELGTSGDIDGALNRNLRRLSMEVDPAKGSPWSVQYGEAYNALDDDEKFSITEQVTNKAIEFVSELTGINFSGNVHGTGGWNLDQNPSTVQQGYMSKEAGREAASMLGYLLNQQEVWLNTAKELTKNPVNYSLDIVEDGTQNLRDSASLSSLFERIINQDPYKLFRGYQPIIVDGNAGIRIIVDKEAISKAIKEQKIKRSEILPYIQQFSNEQLSDITNDLNLNTNNYISEIELEILVNDWTKDKLGGNFKNNFSDKSTTAPESTGRSNIYNFGEQLTKFFASLVNKDSKKITEQTIKKLTKKKLGGTIEIPEFHFGGFIDINRL